MSVPVHTAYRFGSVECDFRARTFIMGVVNATPDSFSDAGAFHQPEAAYRRAMELVEQGADIIDIGGESSRPGARAVAADEELRRVLPVIERLVRSCAVPVSIDTYKSDVAGPALEAGAQIVNDITGLRHSPDIAGLVARHDAGLVLMHMQGSPLTMQENPRYENLIGEIISSLESSASVAESAGVRKIVVDPGIGFGKTVPHNLTIMRRLREFTAPGYPVLVGPSRKSFLGAMLNLPVGERLEGTLAACAIAIQNGAAILRVHDVKEVKRVATVIDAVLRA